MNEELTVSTPEDYVKLTTRKFEVSSTAVFHIHGMNASSMVYLLGILPDEGLADRAEILRFVEENLVGITQHVVQPNIMEPKIADDQLLFLDVVDILMELMDMSGWGVDESEAPE